MKPRRAASCFRCGKVGKPRQLNELLKFDEDKPVIVLCNLIESHAPGRKLSSLIAEVEGVRED